MAATPAKARPQRADARRNVSAILDAAMVCLQRDPAASLSQIAAEAGLGRITVYGHFRTRAELIEAVLAEAMSSADEVLDDVELSGDPVEGVAMLASASWRMVEQFRMVLHAAQRELPSERIRDTHDRVMKRIAELLERGREQGRFRTDVPTEWLVATAVSLMHTAANEVDAGRVDAEQVGWYVVTTLLGAISPPASPPR